MKLSASIFPFRRRRSLLTWQLAILFSLCSTISGFANAQAPQPSSDWWMRTDPYARLLDDQVAGAADGKVEAQITLARMFAKGLGSAEGPKLNAALYWIQRAIDKGATHAAGMAAVLYAVKEPPDLARAGDLIQTVIAKEGAQSKAQESKVGPACLASAYCSGYPRLVSSYGQLMVTYPLEARKQEREAEIVVQVNLGKREVVIIGKDVSADFAEASKSAFMAALKNVPVPLEFDSKDYLVQVPMSFKLTDF